MDDCTTHDWLEEAEALYDAKTGTTFITFTCNVCVKSIVRSVAITPED